MHPQLESEQQSDVLVVRIAKKPNSQSRNKFASLVILGFQRYEYSWCRTCKVY